MQGKWKAGIVLIVSLSIVFEIIPIFLLQNDGAVKDDNGGNPNEWPPNNEDPPDLSYLPIQDCGEYNAFTSRSEIEQRVIDAQDGQMAPGPPGGFGWFGGPTLGAPTAGSPQIGLAEDGSTRDYSDTNVQVANVDEQDIVKSDGEYIYTISGSEVVIVKAYPAEEAGVVSRLQFDTVPVGLFIDEDRLVVIGGWSYDNYYRDFYNGSFYYPDTHVTLVDISDRANPVYLQEYAVNGTFIGARMVDGYAYILTTEFLYDYGNGVALPGITVGAQTDELPPSDIGYFDNDTSSNTITVILAINAAGDGSYSAAGYMTGGFGILYVSYEHLYIAVTIYDYYDDVDNGMWFGMSERTAIHKIAFSGLDTSYVCSGEVPGRLLNQFSMDEYSGNLRVATTTSQFGWAGDDQGNNVYVLDSGMKPLGELEGIAPGELIYSCRFMGDRAYLVTYVTVDPFFVIDLTDPSEPKVAGHVEVPGFSEYLHPYGDDHVIGVGLETIDDPNGGFSWMQGIKISLFDVSDFANPVEQDKVVLGERGSTSDVLSDHKAFMFDEGRGILAIPVSLCDDDGEWRYESIWQGVYVYQVSADDGFQFMGRVTHGSNGQYYYYDELYVRRSLYIEDVLYTVSQGMIMLTALGDMTELGSIEL